jgi:hypothetical protein
MQEKRQHQHAGYPLTHALHFPTADQLAVAAAGITQQAGIVDRSFFCCLYVMKPWAVLYLCLVQQLASFLKLCISLL